jgi:predicted ATPase/DNA-binding XRE family transcriptional regulator
MKRELSFGEWLRKQRRSLDLTRQAFADQVGCAEVTLRRIEAGLLRPSKALASVIIERLGIPENERPQWISFAREGSGLPIQTSPLINKPNMSIPVSLTTFIGREKEQTDVVRLLTKHRLVTLIGAGGIGKTRLAIKVGEQLLGNYPHGVWVLELASLNDPALLEQTAAILFGITIQPQTPFIDLLSNFLRAKSALLVLDNCEHLLDSCAHFVHTLLKNCASLKLLVTSREPLGIIGEVAYRVPPLAVPNFHRLRGKFRDYESVRLFEEGARLARADFAVTMDNGASVAQICKHLDGIPLAIELAAARVSMFSIEQIETRLQKSFKILTQGNRNALPRHQTLQAVFDWSYDLLSPTEQLLFRRLAVFPGVWTLESVEAICAGESINSFAAIDLLSKLVDKSLVIFEQNGRYKFLEIIRQYAREKLLASGELQAIRQRHLVYFLAFVKTKGEETLSSDQIVALKQLDEEYENIRETIDWAIESGQVEEATELATALAWLYWQSRALFQEAYQKTMRIVNHPNTTKEKLFRATALIIAVFHGSFILGDFKQAQAMIDEAIGISKLAGERGENQSAWAYAIWGLCMIGKDNLVAEQVLDMGLSMAREMSDKFLLANTLEFQGALASIRKDYSRAQAFSNESITLFRELGNQWGIARALGNIGLVLYLQEDYQEAKRYLEEALEIHRGIADRNNLITVLGLLGKISALLGKYGQAEEWFEEKLSFAIDRGWTQEIATCTRDLAYLNLYQENPISSLALFRESLSLLEMWDHIGIYLNITGIASALFQNSSQNAEHAAQLLGSAQLIIDSTGIDNLPYEKEQITKSWEAISAYLGEGNYQKFLFRGKDLTLEAAIALAKSLA